MLPHDTGSVSERVDDAGGDTGDPRILLFMRAGRNRGRQPSQHGPCANDALADVSGNHCRLVSR